MFRIPAASSTARTGPPAITPVPSIAGLSRTHPAPKWPTTSWGIVCPSSGTLNRFFFAFSPPLRIASGTSLALPSPTPTCPCPSPTTTSAEKENRRPPFTTFATRLMFTTRSLRSRSLGLIGVAKTVLPFALRLKLQAGLARPFGDGRDPSVVGKAIAVEHDRLHVHRLTFFGDQLADSQGVRLLVALGVAFELLRQRGGKGQRLAARIIHHLRVDVLEAFVDGQAGSLRRPRELSPDPRLSLQPGLDLCHRFLALAALGGRRLAFLAADALLSVLDPLALVRLGRPQRANLHRRRSKHLAVGGPQGQAEGGQPLLVARCFVQLRGDPLWKIEDDRVRETEREVDLPALDLGAKADTSDVQLALPAHRDPLGGIGED